MRTSSSDAYSKTIDRIEPEVAMIDPGGGWASIAISLKRIADVLERLELEFHIKKETEREKRT